MGIIIRQSFKAAIFNYIGILLGFFSLIYILPLVYNPTELGAIRLLTELAAIIGNTALIGMPYAIFRFYPYFKQDPHHNGFYFWAFTIPFLGFLLVLTLNFTLKTSFFNFFTADAEYIQIIFPMLIFMILGFMGQTTFEAIAANQGRIAIPSFFREIYIRSVILLAAGLYYFKYTNFTFSCWIVVFAYLSAFVANLIYIQTLTHVYLKPNMEFFRKNPQVKIDAIKFSAWLFISNTASLFVNKVDFFMISAQLSLTDTAIYSIGFYIAVLIEIPKRNISQISTPILAEHIKNNHITEVRKLYKQISNNQYLLGAILFAFIWINIDMLFHFMPKGELYSKGKYVIFIIGLSKMVEMILSSSISILNNSNHYAWNFSVSILGILSAIGLNYLLIPVYGINGAAIATLITVFLLYSFMTLVISVKMKIHPFSNSQIKTTFILVMVLSLGFITLFPHQILDAGVKNIITLLLFGILILKGKASDEVTEMLNKYLKRK